MRGNERLTRAGQRPPLRTELLASLPSGPVAAVKKKESKLYGAHFKDVDHTQKATKVTFDSDDE